MQPNLEFTTHGASGDTAIRIYDDRVEWTDRPDGTDRTCAALAALGGSLAGGRRRGHGRHRHVVALPTVTDVAIRDGGTATRTIELTAADDTIGFRVPSAAAHLVVEAIRDGMLATA